MDRVAVAGGSPWGHLAHALRRPGRLVLRVARRVSSHRTLTFAAALAYYFLFALFPFLLFLVALVTFLPGVQGLESWLLGRLGEVMPGEASAAFGGAIRSVLEQPRGGLLSLGAVLALWSASSAVVGMTDALNVAYGVTERRPWWRVRLGAIGLTVALSLFMIVAFVLAVSSAPVSRWVEGEFGALGGWAVLVGNWVVALMAVTLVVAAIYDRCPDVERSWRWFSPGSLLFTLGFGATSAAFSAWVAHFGSYDKTYGSLGAVIVLLFWMYLLAVFLLLGGELDAAVAAEATEGGGAAPHADGDGAGRDGGAAASADADAAR
jgi:membrane protein